MLHAAAALSQMGLPSPFANLGYRWGVVIKHVI
jgi:hypothetical protein